MHRGDVLFEFFRFRFGERFELVDHFAVAEGEGSVGLKQERPRAAGRIENLQSAEAFEALPPVGLGDAVGVVVLFRKFAKAVFNEFVERVADDALGEDGGGVVDAQAFAFGGLGHLGVLAGLLEVAGEDAGVLEFFEFGDGAFEEVAQDVEVDFVGEAVLADGGEEVGPRGSRAGRGRRRGGGRRGRRCTAGCSSRVRRRRRGGRAV